jgi:uroporphyrin-III C-methyltransferase
LWARVWGAAAHLTLGALQALQAADLVIHDWLVGADILALISSHVRRIDVRKEGFGPSVSQEGKSVVLMSFLSGKRRKRGQLILDCRHK